MKNNNLDVSVGDDNKDLKRLLLLVENFFLIMSGLIPYMIGGLNLNVDSRSDFFAVFMVLGWVSLPYALFKIFSYVAYKMKQACVFFTSAGAFIVFIVSLYIYNGNPPGMFSGLIYFVFPAYLSGTISSIFIILITFMALIKRRKQQ